MDGPKRGIVEAEDEAAHVDAAPRREAQALRAVQGRLQDVRIQI